MRIYSSLSFYPINIAGLSLRTDNIDCRYELLLRVMNENLGSEPHMKFEMHEARLTRGSQSPSRRRPTDLGSSSHVGNLERALYTQVA